MSNPIMERNPYFKTNGARPNQFSQTQYTSQEYANAYDPFIVEPAADRLTYRDALNKTAILLGTALIAGIATVILLPIGMWTPIAIGASLVSFVLGMTIAFKREVSSGLALAYAVLEGVTLGALTGFVDLYIPGVAFQTILATAVIVAVCLALFYSGTVRTSPKGMKYMMIVALGGIVFAMVNIFVMLFGGPNLQLATIAGIPLGLILGILMLFVASYFLIADFETVQYAVENQAPKSFAWTCALGIVMTILWIYTEVLRILIILNQDQ